MYKYSRSFFALQIAFAQRVAKRFSLPLTDALLRYTPFAVNLGLNESWSAFADDFASASDPLELSYQTYLAFSADEHIPQPEDTRYKEWPLFGCFYYWARDETTIRNHYLNNDQPGMRPLSAERQAVRQAELQRMFLHIRDHVPNATTVQGHSWLYNLPAYTRLFPPSFLREPVFNLDGVLDQMVLWFQCYDRFWEINPAIADLVLRRVDQLARLDDLRLCFPYQRIRTHAPISDFYVFYGIDS